MAKSLEELLREAESENFTQAPSAEGEAPTEAPSPIAPLEESGGIFDFGDTLMAIPRGIVGAGKSAYGLVDALAMDSLPDWNNNPLGESKTVVGGLVEGISEFATGMFVLGGAVGAVGKGVKGAEWLVNAAEMAKTGKTALSLQGRILAGAATDFVAFDGNSGRLTDLVAKVPGLEEPVSRYLGFLLTEEEDGEILGRVKNTLEGAGVGAIVDGVIKSLKFLKTYRRELALGEPYETAIAKADAVQPLKEVQLAVKMSDDFLFAQESPFKGPHVDEVIADWTAGPKPDGAGEMKFVNVDGTPSPVKPSTGAEFVSLSSSEAKSGPELKNWVNLHGTLLQNPMATIGFDSATGKVEIGILVRPDLLENAQVKKILKSVAETTDITPGELGDAASDIRKIGQQMEFEFDRPEPTVTLYRAQPRGGAAKTPVADWVKESNAFKNTEEATGRWWTDSKENAQWYIDNEYPDGEIVEITVPASVAEKYRVSNMKAADGGKAAANNPAAFSRMPESEFFLPRDEIKKAREGGGQKPPKGPEAPGSAGPNPEDPNVPRSSESGAQQSANTGNLSEHAIFLGQAGWDTNDAAVIGRTLGGEFTEGVAERGRIIKNFNSAQPAQVFESGEIMAHPTQYTDAVNPRKLNAFELVGLAIDRAGINLERLKDNDIDAASSIRVIADMAYAMLKGEYKPSGGEHMADMLERVVKQLDIINGKPTIEEQRIWMLRQAKEGAENIDRAAAHAFASLEFSVAVIKDLQKNLADLMAREAAGKGVADWEWANVAEQMGLANDGMASNKAISNALARGLYLQRAKIEPVAIKRMTATELRSSAEKTSDVLIRHGGRDAIKDMAMKITALGPDVDLRKVSVILNKIEASFGSRTMRLMSDVHYASLLSALRTHTVTLMSNTFTALYLPFEQMIQGAVGVARATTPEEVKAFKGMIAEAMGTYAAMPVSLREAMEAGKAAFKNPDGVLKPKSSLYDVRSRSRVPGVSAANLNIQNPAAAEAVDNIGKALSVFTRALGASDEMFKNLAYRSVSRSRLTRMAVEAGKSGPELAQFVEESLDRLIYKGQALSIDQLQRRARDEVAAKGFTGIHATEKANRLVAAWQKEPWYEQLSPLAEFAMGRAEEGTFTNSLRPDSLGSDVKRLLNRNPALKFAVPFVQTPVNVMLFGAQRMDLLHASRWLMETKLLGRDGSAFANSRNRFLREMASQNPEVQSQAVGRIVLGSSFGVFVASLAGQDLITGRGPSDPDMRKALSEAGWLPYSFKFGNTYVSYQRLDPFATIIGTMADIATATDYLPDDKQRDMSELGMGLLVALANNLTNKTYLQGLSNLMEAFSEPGRRLEKNWQAFVSSFMPNITRDLGTLYTDLTEGDTTVKEIRSTMDAIINKIPGWSENLEPRRNALGEPIKKIQPLGQGSLGALAAFPVPISARSSEDPLLQEMASLRYGFSNPSTLRNGYDMADIKAPSGQTSYDRWLENSSTVRIGGKTLREALTAMTQDPRYQGLSNFRVSDQESPRVTAMRGVIDRYRRAAFQQTLGEVPELRAAETNFLVRRAAARAGIELQ